MTDIILEATGLKRAFGKVQAVDDVSFVLERGKVTGFIGPNGAGKTTTMRILATLELPDEGDAKIFGKSVLTDPRTVRAHIGFMADQFRPYRNLDVVQFLDFFARAYGLRGTRRIDTVDSVMDFCGLDDFVERPVVGLSKGMGQRLHLAKTLLHDPALLILDEPAAGLDPRARIEFRALLKELAAAGKSILISSHILAELGETCDTVLVIEHGILKVSGRIEDIANRVRQGHPVQVRVLGDPQAAERFLLTQPDVEELVVDGARLAFAFAGDDEQLAGVLSRAIAAGLAVVEFARMEADLEAIFMHTTEGRLQ